MYKIYHFHRFHVERNAFDIKVDKLDASSQVFRIFAFGSNIFTTRSHKTLINFGLTVIF